MKCALCMAVGADEVGEAVSWPDDPAAPVLLCATCQADCARRSREQQPVVDVSDDPILRHALWMMTASPRERAIDAFSGIASMIGPLPGDSVN